MEKLTFRLAREEDCALILDFIKALAEYEKMSDQVIATEELLREWIFEKKKAEVIFPCLDGKEVGFALTVNNIPLRGVCIVWSWRYRTNETRLFAIPRYKEERKAQTHHHHKCRLKPHHITTR